MNRMQFFLAFATCIALVLAAGCAAGKTLTQADLLHRRFVLESVDGKPFTHERAPDIEFGEGFRVYGAVCNRYTGQGELKNDVLFVKQMASTKMLCADGTLNTLEQDFARMLQDGATVEFADNTLTLRQGGRVLVYKARDWVR